MVREAPGFSRGSRHDIKKPCDQDQLRWLPWSQDDHWLWLNRPNTEVTAKDLLPHFEQDDPSAKSSWQRLQAHPYHAYWTRKMRFISVPFLT